MRCKLTEIIRSAMPGVICCALLGLLGCVAVRKTRTAPIPVALTPPPPRTVTSQARSVAPPSSQVITLVWSNSNPPEVAKYMLTEIASTTDATRFPTFKCYVPAGTNRVTLAKTNGMEFFVCRFVQTNVTPWLVSEWNVK